MATKTPAKKAPARTKKSVARKTATPRGRKTSAARTAKASRAVPTAAAAAAGPRRVVFIDVENTSSEHELARVLDELAIDLTTGDTEITAIGNWRVVGQQLGRSLAQRGAHLVHSAPATRVSDWSDLWIAVQAGIWLGRSRPGDAIDIVSHDRAFDAVGDAAARLGVTFRRITYRSAGPGAAAAERAGEGTGERRRRRRRRGGSGRGAGPTGASSAARPAAATAHAARPAARPAAAIPSTEEAPLAASQEQLEHVIARLAASDPAHTVTLDALTVALKAAGFQRPPGSPRLVTRLRRMKEIEVLPNGRVRMVADAASASAPTAASEDPASEESTADGEQAPAGENGAAAEESGRRRSRRRGGRRRGGRGRKTGAAAPPAAE
ncbi:MAG: hypothetical protein IT294_04970 [Deltaproteobacteria bacterium]|nr:hypothetical protein [Deltaproteobacteria bacterium]